MLLFVIVPPYLVFRELSSMIDVNGPVMLSWFFIVEVIIEFYIIFDVPIDNPATPLS